jgi:hypothetical protein
MSRARPMTTEDRFLHYARGRSRFLLTGPQSRRLAHKAHRGLAPGPALPVFEDEMAKPEMMTATHAHLQAASVFRVPIRWSQPAVKAVTKGLSQEDAERKLAETAGIPAARTQLSRLLPRRRGRRSS